MRVVARQPARGDGAELVVIKSMKVQHAVTAPNRGLRSEVTPAGAPVRGERADLQAV